MDINSKFGIYRSVAFRTWTVGEASRIFAAKREASLLRLHNHNDNKNKSNASNNNETLPLKEVGNYETGQQFLQKKPLASSVRKVSLKCLGNDRINNDGVPLNLSLQNINSIDVLNLTLPNYNLKSKSTAQLKQMKIAKTDDCYSSTEYVKYCNVAIDNKIENQSTLSESLNTLHDYFMLRETTPITNNRLCSKFPSTQFQQDSEYLKEPNGKSISAEDTEDHLVSSFREKTKNNVRQSYKKKLGRLFSQQQQQQQITSSQTDFGSVATTPTLMTSENNYQSMINTGDTVTLPQLHYSPKNSKKEGKYSIPHRAKSLDNISKLNVLPKFHRNLPFVATTQIQKSKKTKTLQSAKNFLRKLYSNSTLKFHSSTEISKPPNVIEQNHNKNPNSEHFKTPISPFFEIRVPHANELPFLPYNIHYQVDDDDTQSFSLNTETMCAENNLQALNPLHTSTPIPKEALLATTSRIGQIMANYNSPDEGVYSSSSESGAEIIKPFCENLKLCTNDNFCYANERTLVRQKLIAKYNETQENILRPTQSSNFDIIKGQTSFLENQEPLFTVLDLDSNTHITTADPTTSTESDYPCFRSNSSLDQDSGNSSLGQSTTYDKAIPSVLTSANADTYLTTSVCDDVMLTSTSTLTQPNIDLYNNSDSIPNVPYDNMYLSFIQPQPLPSSTTYRNDFHAKRSSSVEPNASLRVNTSIDRLKRYQDNSYYHSRVNLKAQNISNLEPKPSNWNDLFRFLRNEINNMRSSDIEIWKNLKTIEKELHVVVNQTK